MATNRTSDGSAHRSEISLTGVPRIGRATMVGALLGAVVVGGAVATVLVLAGAGPAAAIAGMHVGFFGGMGYGGMLGAVVRSDRFDEQNEPATGKAFSDGAPGIRTATSSEGIRHAYLRV